MAVNYANALAKRIDGSFLCCTRSEGLLKQQLSPEVHYLFLKKNNTFDIRAFLKLQNFVREHNIDIIQAHSSSWFLALTVKLSFPKIKLVWHDHYGKELQERNVGLLKMASFHFDAIISVNIDLKEWAKKHLHVAKVEYFRNFFSSLELPVRKKVTSLLQGNENDFKILCLANLRPQKDHLNLLKAFLLLEQQYSEVSLHLIGKDEHDEYSSSLKNFIQENNKGKKIFFYGDQEDVRGLIKQADLGVLSSLSEGLPVALLEYGFFGIPVVCTKVGQCSAIVEGVGIDVPPNDSKALYFGIKQYLENSDKRNKDAQLFHTKIVNEYSEERIIPKAIEFFNKLLNASRSS